MTKNYYLKNLFWGLLFFCMFLYSWYPDKEKMIIATLFSLPSSLLYPYAKKLIENIALRYTTREFWSKGLFIETPAKSGAYAIFYMFCFIFALPLGGIYFLLKSMKVSIAQK